MMFDGLFFRRSHKVIVLPHDMWVGEHKNYVMFGRLCKKDTPGAIKSYHEWPYGSPFGDEPEIRTEVEKAGEEYWPAYVVPIKCRGHGLTNKMFGEDGNTYLCYDGIVYVHGKKKKK